MTSTTLDALKALYVALGGSSSTVADLTVIPDVINAIATFISGGGAAELPAVTAENNGQVLTVVSGAWAAAALPASEPANEPAAEEITG
jgi:hypothetical protein